MNNTLLEKTSMPITVTETSPGIHAITNSETKRDCGKIPADLLTKNEIEVPVIVYRRFYRHLKSVAKAISGFGSGRIDEHRLAARDSRLEVYRFPRERF